MSESLQILSATHGIAPRSDELLRLGTDFEKGRASQESLEAQIAQETQAWLDVQTAAGIDLPENGRLRWQDHLRPLVKAGSGFAPDIDDAAVTRWFEDNRFYRQPTIVGTLGFDPARFEAVAGTPGSSFSLIGPETFSHLCQSGEYQAENIWWFYLQVLDYLYGSGVDQVLLEDYVGGNTPQSDALAADNPDLHVSVVAIGEPPTASPLKPTSSGDLVLQVADSTSTVEDTLDVSTWPIEKLREASVSRLILTHSVDLERLPLPYAQEKIKWLGDITARVQTYLEEKL